MTKISSLATATAIASLLLMGSAFAQTAAPAKLQELAGIGQFVDGMLDLLEVSVEPGFQLRQRQVRGVAAVELNERQTKFGAKLFQRHLGDPRLVEDKVGRAPDGGQIIDQRA